MKFPAVPPPCGTTPPRWSIPALRYWNIVGTVGFGIATPQQAAAMAKVSDGAIVGSAIIKLFAQYGPAAVPHIEAFVRDMAQVVHNA